MSRRDLLKLPALLIPTLSGAKEPDGPPWFTDLAAKAGLTEPVVYGGVDHKKFILETNGCGIAFYDYDHDGWLDILVPGGSRLEAPPPAPSIRLYKNNRNRPFTHVPTKPPFHPLPSAPPPAPPA